MAYNPSPKVAAARDIGEKFKKQQVIVLMIDIENGTLEYSSWGETKALCSDAKHLADKVYEAVMDAVATS